MTFDDAPRSPDVGAASAASLPSAFDALEFLPPRGERRVAVLLDYDGTLTPIVDRPEQAVLGEQMRERLRRLAAVVPVAVVSGRDLDDLRGRVGLEAVAYCGSHGFDIALPGEVRRVEAGAATYLQDLDAAATALDDRLAAVPGALVERKRFAISVHVRLVEERRKPEVAEAVREVASRFERLRLTGGKQVLELRPNVDWHKGHALRSLVAAWGAPPVLPLYLGDDDTDEDAFRAVREDGIGIVVGEREVTEARFRLDDVEDVARWLDALLERLEARPGRLPRGAAPPR